MPRTGLVRPPSDLSLARPRSLADGPAERATRQRMATIGWRERAREAAAARPFALALCAAVTLGWLLVPLVPDPDEGLDLGPDWLPVAAAAIAATALSLEASPRWHRVGRALLWIGMVLLVWAANGLPFDVLTAAGLIGHRTASGAIVMSQPYWPGLAMRLVALVAAVVVARRAFARPAHQSPSSRRSVYGNAAFVLALPYPLLRLHWALGGTIGLAWPGAAGHGFAPMLIAIPWLLAAVLSLLLAAPPAWMPRRLLLAGGWSATAIVALVGPAACWALLRAAQTGADVSGEIATWVFGVIYGSWLLWAIAAAAATRSYQSSTA